MSTSSRSSLRRVRATSLVFATAIFLGPASCGGGTTTPTPTPTTVVGVSPTTASITVGGTAQLTPSATKGGAAIPGETFSFTSNAAAVATVSSTGMVTGVAVGTATITVTASSGGSASAGIAVTATAAVPASMAKTAGDNQTTTLGSAVAIAPSVTVKDAAGAGISGLVVVFAVASGGGSVTGASATTNSAGVATVGGWTLGSVAGANTLTASLGALTALTFTATAVAPAPSSVSFASQQVVMAQAATVPTTATVKDAGGATVTGAQLTYTSRTPAVATVSTGGVITGVAVGQAVIIVNVSPTIADSLLAIVTTVGAPVIVSSVSTFAITAGATTTVSIYVDMTSSSKKVSSGQIDVKFTPAQMTYVSHAAGANAAAVVNATGAATGIVRLSFADPSGFAGKVEVLKITFTNAATVGTTGSLQLIANDLAASDFTNLASAAANVTRPLVIR